MGFAVDTDLLFRVLERLTLWSFLDGLAG